MSVMYFLYFTVIVINVNTNVLEKIYCFSNECKYFQKTYETSRTHFTHELNK